MIEFYPAEFSFPAFLEEIVEICRTRAECKGITFTYHNTDRLPDRVRADQGLLRKVLEHLLNHAIQMTKAEGVTFTVKILDRSFSSNVFAANSQLRFLVEDTGCCLTAEAWNRLDLKSELHLSGSHTQFDQKPQPIQELMDRMGSALHSHNLPGVGSLVWMDLTFPIACHVPRSMGSTNLGRESAASQSSGDRPPPLKILVAEDIPINQKLALKILKRLGYEADVAANGVEVLDALGRQFYDVVFMDVQMPQMDGLEATRRIRRELPNDRHPWIIALTANAAIGDRDTCLAVGMNDYLSKPIDVKALEQSLRQCPIASQ
jgi:CheY-like chemotaxis protein